MLASKLQHSQMKVKELKIKEYYMEKELSNIKKKEERMRDCMY